MKISNNKNRIPILTYADGSTIRYDHRVRTKDGWVSRVYAFGVPVNVVELAHLGQGDVADIVEQQNVQPKLAVI